MISGKPERLKQVAQGKPTKVNVSEERYRTFGDTAIYTYRLDDSNADGQKLV